MLTVSLLIGIVLVYMGGYDLAQYMQNPSRRSLIYTVITSSLGLLNVCLGAGVFQ